LEQFGLPASCRPDHAGHLHADEADLFPRKLNESTTKVEDPAVLKQPLTDPKVKKITLHFPLGLEVVARNMKGVTIKDEEARTCPLVLRQLSCLQLIPLRVFLKLTHPVR
jgi:hypothetical protein